MNAAPDNVDRFVAAVEALHNFAMKNQILSEKNEFLPNNHIDHYDDQGNFVPGPWHNEIPLHLNNINCTENDPPTANL